MVGLDIPQNTHHHCTQIFRTYGKDGLIDAFHYFLCRNCKCARVAVVERLLWKFSTINTYKVELTIHVVDVNFQSIIIDLEFQSLLGKRLQQFVQTLHIDRKLTRTFGIVHHQTGL